MLNPTLKPTLDSKKNTENNTTAINHIKGKEVHYHHTPDEKNPGRFVVHLRHAPEELPHMVPADDAATASGMRGCRYTAFEILKQADTIRDIFSVH